MLGRRRCALMVGGGEGLCAASKVRDVGQEAREGKRTLKVKGAVEGKVSLAADLEPGAGFSGRCGIVGRGGGGGGRGNLLPTSSCALSVEGLRRFVDSCGVSCLRFEYLSPKRCFFVAEGRGAGRGRGRGERGLGSGERGRRKASKGSFLLALMEEMNQAVETMGMWLREA